MAAIAAQDVTMTKREKQLVDALRNMIELYDWFAGNMDIPTRQKVKLCDARQILKQYDTKEKKTCQK